MVFALYMIYLFIKDDLSGNVLCLQLIGSEYLLLVFKLVNLNSGCSHILKYIDNIGFSAMRILGIMSEPVSIT